jgi:histone H3/H4
MPELPLASLDRVLKRAGAPRVSDSASAELAQVIEDVGIEIGKEAVKIARSNKRKTVMASDIQKAVKLLFV